MADIITVGLPGRIGGFTTAGLLGPTVVVVPDIVGLLDVAAINEVIAAGLDPIPSFVYSPTVPIDEVISQVPVAGSAASPGSPVLFVVSLGAAVETGYTVQLTIGPTHVLTQDVVYALPARSVKVSATAAVEISVDGSTWDDLTGAETVGAETGAVFIRAHDSDNVSVKLAMI